MKNRLCEILGVKYPIICGAMQWVSSAALVAAVSEAGAFGILGTADKEKEYVRNEINKIREATSKPFAVNITILSKTSKDVFEVALEEKVPFIVLAAGNPAPFIPTLKEAGIPFFAIVANVKQAMKLEQLGASFVIAEGQEAGGHIGEMTTMAMIPQIASNINIPVVAAGGIADGRGLAAALMLGAEGIQMGTAFLASKEAEVHPNFKKAIIEANSSKVVVTGRQVNHAVRCLDNELAKAFRELDARFAKPEEYAEVGTGAAYKASQEGDVVNGSVMIGQIVGLVKHERSVSEIIQSIISEYNNLCHSLVKL